MSNSHDYDVSINKDYTLECTNSSSDTKRYGGQKRNKHHYSYYGEKSKNSIYTINVCKIQTMVSRIKQNKILWITMSVFLQNFTHLLLKKDDFASEIISTHYEMMQLVWHLHRGSRVLLQA